MIRAVRPSVAVCVGDFAPAHDAARRDGLAVGLKQLCALVGVDEPPAGPTGIAPVLGSGPAGSRHFDLPGGPVTFVRRSGRPSRPAPVWHLGVVWVRLGLSAGLRDACVEHLRNRVTGDGVILRQQMVKGQLADVLVRHLEVAAVLAATPAEQAAPALYEECHRALVTSDRELVRLFGASGYVVPGPGLTADVSELLANTLTAAEELA